MEFLEVAALAVIEGLLNIGIFLVPVLVVGFIGSKIEGTTISEFFEEN